MKFKISHSKLKMLGNYCAMVSLMSIICITLTYAQNRPVTQDDIRASMEKHLLSMGPDYNKYAHPKMEVINKFKEDGYERWHVKYLVDENEYCYAYLLIPNNIPKGVKRPAVLCPHPTANIGKDRVVGIYQGPAQSPAEEQSRANRLYAVELAKKGFVTFAPDRAAYGERRLEKDGGFTLQMNAFQKYLSAKYPGFTLSGKSVYDLKIALSILEKLDFVDPENIGIIGHSLGAIDAIMLAGFDQRVKAAVVNSGSPIRYEAAWWDMNSNELRTYLQNPDIKGGLDKHMNFYVMMAAPRSVLYQYSIADPAYWEPNIVEAHRAIYNYYSSISGTKKIDYNVYFHGQGHDFTDDSRTLSYRWLENRLMKKQSNPDKEVFVPAAIDIANGYAQHFDNIENSYPAGWTMSMVARVGQTGTDPNKNPRTQAPVANAPKLMMGTAASKGNFVYNFGGKLGFKNGSSSDYALLVSLNTKSVKTSKSIKGQFDAMVMRNLYDGTNNTLINELVLQYRIGETGDFINLKETIRNGENKQTIGIKPADIKNFTFELPKECSNQPVVQLRWITKYISGKVEHSDGRPSFAVDNFIIEKTL